MTVDTGFFCGFKTILCQWSRSIAPENIRTLLFFMLLGGIEKD